jgi:DNA-binding NarL/FixJ family response regulator
MDNKLKQYNFPEDGKNLSPREKEILVLLANGLKNSEISVRLNISVRTVEWHRSNMLAKFNLNNASQLAILASEYTRKDINNNERSEG